MQDVMPSCTLMFVASVAFKLTYFFLLIVLVVSDSSQELKPCVGQRFKSLDFAGTFYEVYALAVGSDTRKQ